MQIEATSTRRLKTTPQRSLEPNFPRAYANRGMIFTYSGKPDKAIEDFTQAIRLNPADPFPYHGRATAYQVQGKFDAAIEDFSTVLMRLGQGLPRVGTGLGPLEDPDLRPAIDLKAASAYYNRGLAYASRGDIDKALADFTQAIRNNPKFGPAYNNRGVANQLAGKHDDAMTDYSKAIELNPKDARAYHGRGTVYQSKGDFKKAIEDFSEAVRIDPKFGFAYFNRGVVYARLKDYSQAIKDYDETIRLYPKYAAAHNDKAWLLATCVDPKYRDGKKAVELATIACEQSKQTTFLDTLAAAYAETGDFERAISTQKKACADKTLSAENRSALEKRLKSYEQKRPYREE